MAELPNKVWVAHYHAKLDSLGPALIDEYVLVRRVQNGVKIREHGIERTIRQSEGRHFFFTEADALAFCREKLKAKLEKLEEHKRWLLKRQQEGPTIVRHKADATPAKPIL
jgi:hypothetical protein